MESFQLLNAPQVPMQMIALGMLLLAAHLGGKCFNRFGLSDATGNLIGGTLVGPYVLHLPFLITAIFAGFLVANFHSHAIFDSLKLDYIAVVQSWILCTDRCRALSCHAWERHLVFCVYLHIVTHGRETCGYMVRM